MAYATREEQSILSLEVPAGGTAAFALDETLPDAVNEGLADNPGLVNESPYGEGWLFAIAISDPAEWDTLLSAEAYIELLDAET